ncbi:MAG: TonB-dependent receptor [Ferruginibacter sp.]|nr:TonB-dependent receptor [Ferruginibacter sp.]
MNKIIHLLIFLLMHDIAFAQEVPAADSSLLMNEVVITAFEQNRAISCGTIVKVINNSNTDRYNKTSLVHAFNAVAGTRMEERSPGSYRINIRGSSLRSPFGVRNVKIYWNNIPVTDAGGNTYFNQFAFNNFSFIEIFKGPAGSMYGAGTGGVLLMHSFSSAWQPAVKAEYITGSYGLQNIFLSAGFGDNNRRNQVTYNHSQSDGYRNHTKSKRDNISFTSQLNFSDRQQLTTSILYNNLFYETPGGLTKAEFLADPKQARPAAGGFPGADVAKAAIYQKNFTAGISHRYKFFTGFTNATAVFGTFALIQNPTFRNYERRNEPGFGGRTSFIYEKKIRKTKLQVVAGGELQKGFFNTQVSKNKNGIADTLQTNDDIAYFNSSIFMQADVSIKDSWFITAGASINKTKVKFTRQSSYPVLKQGRTYKNEISPRVAVQKKFKKGDAVFASVARGFSPPTIAELLPSTGVISTFLEAESGINYELGGKISLLKGRLRLEATGYYFKLSNALVSRKDSSNADYFINAGNTRQRGMEVSADYFTSFATGVVLDNISIRTAYTLNSFSYGDFKKGTADFSGKKLPGVPEHTVAALADINFKHGIYLNTTWYYATRMFLDDANTVEANAYNLSGFRAGWKPVIKSKLKINLYAGVDNLLNETYSLGNDINAAGGRYYNAAPGRNFYAGVSVEWGYTKKK